MWTEPFAWHPLFFLLQGAHPLIVAAVLLVDVSLAYLFSLLLTWDGWGRGGHLWPHFLLFPPKSLQPMVLVTDSDLLHPLAFSPGPSSFFTCLYSPFPTLPLTPTYPLPFLDCLHMKGSLSTRDFSVFSCYLSGIMTTSHSLPHLFWSVHPAKKEEEKNPSFWNTLVLMRSLKFWGTFGVGWAGVGEVIALDWGIVNKL